MNFEKDTVERNPKVVEVVNLSRPGSKLPPPMLKVENFSSIHRQGCSGSICIGDALTRIIGNFFDLSTNKC